MYCFFFLQVLTTTIYEKYLLPHGLASSRSTIYMRNNVYRTMWFYKGTVEMYPEMNLIFILSPPC